MGVTKVQPILVLRKLVYENNLVGYRINTGEKEYDISLEDFNLIITDFNPPRVMKKVGQPPPVNLISRGNLLVPEGLTSAKELLYRDYAKLCGYTNIDKTDINLKELYNKYNAEIFNNKLPTLAGVEWSSTMHRAAGVCKPRKINGEILYRIALSTSYHSINDELHDTLVHEMIHILYPNDGHGYAFLSEASKINSQFNMNIQVYAHGDVQYKYLYECEDCSQKYERMKRIDTSRRLCGSCRGRILLIFEN